PPGATAEGDPPDGRLCDRGTLPRPPGRPLRGTGPPLQPGGGVDARVRVLCDVWGQGEERLCQPSGPGLLCPWPGRGPKGHTARACNADHGDLSATQPGLVSSLALPRGDRRVGADAGDCSGRRGSTRRERGTGRPGVLPLVDLLVGPYPGCKALGREGSAPRP